MPEGDSIHKLANTLTRGVVGKTIRAISIRNIDDAITRSLVGQKIESAIARGKNLLLMFEDGRALHIHLRMLGRVRVTQDPPRYPSQLEIRTDGAYVIGWKIPVLRLLRKGAIARTAEITLLGPDLIAEDFDEREALNRLRALADFEIGDAIMQQRAVSGIGNVYKSEILFIEKIHPRTRIRDLTDDAILGILRCARKLLRLNVARRGPRITRGLLGPRHHVYERAGRRCVRCSTIIERMTQGTTPGRSTYFCATCQRAK